MIHTQTGEPKCLILEGFENANLVTLPMRYVDESDEMMWWSERSNWGHFYLYDRTGNLKNPITSGDFRASAIISLDTKNRVLYFRGNARKPSR
jgi:dipeptidyl-peptidase 4